jgi:hypothetical protein
MKEKGLKFEFITEKNWKDLEAKLCMA